MIGGPMTVNSKTPNPGEGRRRLVVIHNPTAGRRRRRGLATALDLLEGRVHATHRLTTARGDAEAFARDTPAGVIAVVAGGDGTANEVANGLLAAGGGAMAVIPLGTANVLAAELDILGLPAAAAAVHSGTLFAYRPGMANGRGFLIIAGARLPAPVVRGVLPALERP